MFSSYLLDFCIFCFLFPVKNHHKNLHTESVFGEIHVSVRVLLFTFIFWKEWKSFRHWTSPVDFFPLSCTNQGNRAKNTRWHRHTVTHIIVSKVFPVAFTLGHPAIEHVSKQLSFPRPKSYKEGMIYMSRDCLPTAALTLDCRDLQPFLVSGPQEKLAN